MTVVDWNIITVMAGVVCHVYRLMTVVDWNEYISQAIMMLEDVYRLMTVVDWNDIVVSGAQNGLVYRLMTVVDWNIMLIT